MLAAFPLAQMLAYGTSNYPRSADAIVVFGARVYADGAPSLALADRVQTAVGLLRVAHATKFIASGGPGDGKIDEAQAMSQLAQRLGVEQSALVLDPLGLNTRATAENTRRLLSQRSEPRVLAVSHGYHLPRVKLALQQAGLRAYTVPARETRLLRAMPYFVLREIVAFWAYYLGFD